jgi:hypothetical protein
MAGRATTSGKAGKPRRRTAAKRKHAAPVASPRTRSSAIDSPQQINRLAFELEQAHEREAATAEVLRVISSFAGNLELIFQTILEKATELCEAKFGDIFRFDGNNFRFAARVGTPPKLAEFQQQRGPFRPISGAEWIA